MHGTHAVVLSWHFRGYWFAMVRGTVLHTVTQHCAAGSLPDARTGCIAS